MPNLQGIRRKALKSSSQKPCSEDCYPATRREQRPQYYPRSPLAQPRRSALKPHHARRHTRSRPRRSGAGTRARSIASRSGARPEASEDDAAEALARGAANRYRGASDNEA